jgi:hypothetical protein
MIIKISLLSSDKIHKEERTEYLAVGYAVITVLLIALLSNYAVKLRSYKKLETRIVKAEAELAKYQTIVSQVDSLQATKKVLETKKSIIDSLMASGLFYPKFMETIAEKTTPGIAIKTMNTTLRPDGSIDAVLDADAVDNYSIADFIGTLASDPGFSKIDLGAISSGGGAKSGSSFHLTFSHAGKKI